MEEHEALTEIERFLRQLEVRYARRKVGNHEIIGAPWVIEEKEFLVVIKIQSGWIWLSAAILLKEEFPRENERDFLLECLKTNHELPEVCFDVDQEGNLGTSQELHATILKTEGGFAEFKYEFLAIPACIKYFITKIAPKFNLTVNGFDEMVNKFIENER